MPYTIHPRIAILYSGDRESRNNATPERTRFLKLFQAFSELGARAECAVYHDDFRDEVRRQLSAVNAVLVWVNPIEGGRNRSLLDAMLRDISAQGILVSAHPDTILAMGTKEVLYRTRNMGWGCDTHVYRSMEAMRRELTRRLSAGEARVLKQHRGNGGNGVWKIERVSDGPCEKEAQTSHHGMLIRTRHARRGSVDETMNLAAFLERIEGYFAGDGLIVDQAYLPRLPEGMIRCYLVHDKVAGFGHQAINALCPPLPGAPAGAAPQPTPRIYHPPTMPEYQRLKRRLEQEWVPEMQRLLDIRTSQLPVLWDCDFLLGARAESGEDTYVLCEINVSCVAPFPDAAVTVIAKATLDELQQTQTNVK